MDMVGGIPAPLKNMSASIGMMNFSIYGKIKNVPNHPTSHGLFFGCICVFLGGLQGFMSLHGSHGVMTEFIEIIGNHSISFESK